MVSLRAIIKMIVGVNTNVNVVTGKIAHTRIDSSIASQGEILNFSEFLAFDLTGGVWHPSSQVNFSTVGYFGSGSGRRNARPISSFAWAENGQRDNGRHGTAQRRRPT